MDYKQLTTNELIEYVKKFKWTRKIKKVHIHHTWRPNHASFYKYGAKETQYGMYNYHVYTNGWSDIAQNLTLFPDGTWGIGRDFNKTPISISGHNTGGFAIEMVGNFDIGNDKFGGDQEAAIMKFLYEFLDIMFLDTSDIIFHREYSQKTCPGTSIKKDEFIKNISLKGEDMSERIGIKFTFDGKIIENLEKETVDKLASRLDDFSVYVPESRAYTYAGRDLKYGDWNSSDYEDVILYQRAINEIRKSDGLTLIDEDGQYGVQAKNSCISFQTKYGLGVSGTVTRATADKMNEVLIAIHNTPVDNTEFDQYTPLVELTHELVNYTKFKQTRPVQFMLKELGYTITVDGHYGSGSASVVNTYKESKGLPQDGKVDATTWKHLNFDYDQLQKNNKLKINWIDAQTKVLRVKRSEIDLDVIVCNQPTETAKQVYARLEDKPLLITNGTLYGMSNGVTLGLVVDEGEEVEFGYYSKWFIGQSFDGELKLYGGYWEKQTHGGTLDHIKEGIGASPTLVIGGERNVDAAGLDSGFINNKHPRTIHALDDEWYYVILVHGRDSTKGFVGLTIEECVELMLMLKVKDAINLDGGFSTTAIDQNGQSIDELPGDRSVDNVVALRLK